MNDVIVCLFHLLIISLTDSLVTVMMICDSLMLRLRTVTQLRSIL
jgi:hypothetical protein